MEAYGASLSSTLTALFNNWTVVAAGNFPGQTSKMTT